MHPIRHESSAHRRSRTLSIGNSSTSSSTSRSTSSSTSSIINIIIIINITITGTEKFNGTNASTY